MAEHGPHREDIKAAIRKKGRTLSQLSRELGHDRTAVSVALKQPWPKVRTGIADLLGTTPAALWPADYHPDGTPKSARRHTGKATRRRGGSIGQKSSGALAA